MAPPINTKWDKNNLSHSKLSAVTFNVQGLRNKNKRKSVFRQLRESKYDICALQETYILQRDSPVLEREWVGSFHMSEGTVKQKGLITLFGANLRDNEKDILYYDDRMIISTIKMGQETVYIINVYAPCIQQEKFAFLQHVTNMIIKYRVVIENSICLGDFNMVMDNELDVISGNPHTKQSIENFKKFALNLDLKDAWRMGNPRRKEYTWSRPTPFVARRLDYILVGDNLVSSFKESSITSLGFSDHRACSVVFEFLEVPRGPSFYRLNTSLLSNVAYFNMMAKAIQSMEYQFNDLDPHLKWEMMKVSIKEMSQQFSKQLQGQRKSRIEHLRHQLNTLEKEIAENPGDVNIVSEKNKITKEMEINALAELRGAQIRAGIKWIEQGERNCKYFLSLEKHRAKNNVISHLRSEKGEVFTDHLEILNRIATYYEDLYKETNTQDVTEHLQNFKRNLNIPQVSEHAKEYCDSNITEEEVKIAVSKMNNGSSPGLDGIPVEFYKIFWEYIKEPLLKSFQYSFETGILSVSQRKGVISLLHKGKNLPKDDLKNWRPISLTNSDYKILAKVLALRLSDVISTVIHDDQKGFIKGRRISDIIRELDDVIEYQKFKLQPGIILAIDYEKAFDTVSSDFILDAFKSFGFGPYFMRWVETLMKGRLSCAKNGGFISRPFNVERGVRQGCPIAPLIFVLAVEILALSIRQDERIKGIQLPGSQVHIKLSQYADDTTLFLKDIIDFREVLSKIKKFSLVSGLKLNKSKSKAFCPCQPDAYGASFEEIFFYDRINILGIQFSSKKSASELEENYNPKIDAIEKMLKQWTKRDLTMLGKVQIIKTFGISQLTYLMQSLSIPSEVIKRINQMFFRFIWKKRFSNTRAFEKVKRKVLYNKLEDGGLNMINLEHIQDAYLLQWSERLLTGDNEIWKIIPRWLFQPLGSVTVFESSVDFKSLKGKDKIRNPFWKKTLEVWLKHSENNQNSNSIFQPIFNNQNITYKNSPIFLESCIERNIVCVSQIIEGEGIISLERYLTKFGKSPASQLEYRVLRASLTKFLKTHNTKAERETPKFKNIQIGSIKYKGFRQAIQSKAETYASSFWSRKYNVENAVLNNMWKTSCGSTKETRLIMLQWKILHNIYPTQILLTKMGISESNLCKVCKEIEFIEHFFATCSTVSPLWKEIENQIAAHVGTRIHLEEQTIVLGYHPSTTCQYTKKVNHALLIGKLAISKVKYGTQRNLIETFNSEASLRKLWG